MVLIECRFLRAVKWKVTLERTCRVKFEIVENCASCLYGTMEKQRVCKKYVIQGELLRDRWLQVSAVGLWHTGAHPQYLTAGGGWPRSYK